MVKLGGMNLNISYRLGFPAKVRKHRSFEIINWDYYLTLTVERKGLLIVEVTQPYVQ